MFEKQTSTTSFYKKPFRKTSQSGLTSSGTSSIQTICNYIPNELNSQNTVFITEKKEYTPSSIEDQHDCITLIKEIPKECPSTEKNKRKKLKLRKNDKNSNNIAKSSSTIHFSTEEKIIKNENDRKRKIAETISLLEDKNYKAKKIQIKNFYQGRVQLFDIRKKMVFNFRCFNDNELGFSQANKYIIESKIDNDIETDDETLDYYVKKCKIELKEAIKNEKERKNLEMTEKKMKNI